MEHPAFKMATPTNLPEKKEEPTSDDEAKFEQQKRMDLYYGLITAGLTTFVWKDALQMLERVNMNSIRPVVAVYFCFAVTAMVLGMVACKFPMSAPCSMGIAGHGAFQALVFMLFGLHLDTFNYHANAIWAIGCACAAGILLTVYWGCSTDDPMVLSVCLKYVASAASWSCSCICSSWGKLVNKLQSFRTRTDDTNLTAETKEGNESIKKPLIGNDPDV